MILWIDDQPCRGEILKDIGVGVIFAHGFDQIDYYLNKSPFVFRLIICDHDMPMMNGLDVCKQFLINQAMPVIICSNNYPAAQKMLALLTDYDVKCSYVPISALPDFKREVVGFLASVES